MSWRPYCQIFAFFNKSFVPTIELQAYWPPSLRTCLDSASAKYIDIYILKIQLFGLNLCHKLSNHESYFARLLATRLTSLYNNNIISLI